MVNGLSSQGNPMPVGQRSFVPSIMALVKRTIETVASNVARTEVFKVRIANEKAYGDYFNKILQRIDNLNSTIKNLPKIDMGDSPASLTIQTMSEATINRLSSQLEGVKQAVLANKPQQVAAPKLQKVEVINPTRTQEFPLQQFLKGLDSLEQAINKIKLDVPQAQEIKFPEMPKQMSMVEGAALLKALEGLTKKVDALPKSFPTIDIPNKVSITNFPPQKYPNPVTHMSINALNGFAKTSSVTVTTALTPLPGEVLAYRRSLVIYNNSSVVVEIGGSDFTFGTGMPIPANSYSPAFDAGQALIVYGRVSTGSANVRVLEVSDEHSGR